MNDTLQLVIFFVLLWTVSGWVLNLIAHFVDPWKRFFTVYFVVLFLTMIF